MMDNWQKHNLSLVLICVVCSVAASLLAVALFFPRYTAPEITQTATQTVNINEPAAQRKVNINTATSHELQSLPGIGEVLAGRIIENRPYADVWELVDIDGIGGNTLRNIIERIEVN